MVVIHSDFYSYLFKNKNENKTTIEYACKKTDPDILHMDLRVLFRVLYVLFDEIKINVNNILLFIIIKQL